jgi:hypothetical protein
MQKIGARDILCEMFDVMLDVEYERFGESSEYCSLCVYLTND